jgi:phage-related protein
MSVIKPLSFRGTSLDDLRAFSTECRKEAGFQLDKVQHGEMPDDFKPMSEVGKGVLEIRVRDETGAYRVFYIAKFEAAVYVLHCFKKKTQKTRQEDLDLGHQRYQELVKELRKESGK